MVNGGDAVRPYDDDYLMRYSAEHVAYEFDMFLWLVDIRKAEMRIDPLSPANARRLTNVFVENSVVHLRNVIDFFYTMNPKPTDIIAADFCADGVWQPTISETLELARIRANKEIAHLTTDRIFGTPEHKAWNFPALSTELRTEMRRFVEAARPSRLSPKVAEVIR